jgi:diaminohydroxyphosphoribosylaminopyrimidine deaminase/5-amino-6-(5-phosphoribosylamino)uracil reductase
MGNNRRNRLDEYYIQRTLELAWTAAGKTHPNPLVGAVVVKDGDAVSEGFHQKAGEPHAEAIALEKAGERARGATLYVNLEPCSHHGRTPPCVDKILESGVRRVVVSTRDPFEEVNGRGIAKLRAGGVAVETGFLPDRAVLLNLPYFKRHVKTDRPQLITIKMAISMDGKLSSKEGEKSEVTMNKSREWVHRLRAQHSSIIIGINTLLIDKPKLDCRHLNRIVPPVPVVLDTHLRFPSGCRWISEERFFYVCTGASTRMSEAAAKVSSCGKLLSCGEVDGVVDINCAVRKLADEGLTSVLVEGGASVFSSFIENDLWDAMYVFTGPKLFGLEGVPLFRNRRAIHLNGEAVSASSIGNDFLYSYMNSKTKNSLLSKLLEES